MEHQAAIELRGSFLEDLRLCMRKLRRRRKQMHQQITRKFTNNILLIGKIEYGETVVLVSSTNNLVTL